MNFWSDDVAQAKREEKRKEEKKAQQEFQQEEEQFRQEAAQDVGNVFGTETLEGTGYSTFKELVAAKNKKIKEIEENRASRKASGIGTLIGSSKTLG